VDRIGTEGAKRENVPAEHPLEGSRALNRPLDSSSACPLSGRAGHIISVTSVRVARFCVAYYDANKAEVYEMVGNIIRRMAHPVFACFSDPGTPQSGRAKEVFRFAPIA
jgi:hypothetical protein